MTSPRQNRNAEPAARAGISELAKQYRKVCVFGLGYVGLPTALMFARGGFDVHGVDVSDKVIGNIQENQVVSLYPELTEWWGSVRETGNFSVDTKPVPSDVFLIAVPTPVNPKTKRCDLSAVKVSARAIADVIKPGNLVVLESTVPPGTTRNILKPILESAGLRVGKDIHLCFSPERVLPGNTTHELVHNHRVMGGTTEESASLAKEIFRTVIEGDIYTTDDRTAEFCKIAENTARDVNIALANELSILADEYGIDIREAQYLINMHPRVNILRPGIGVGGHCIAVDPWFFVEASPGTSQLIATARRVNDSMPGYSANKIIKDVEHIKNPRICLVGLTYKPDVADTRESPSLRLVEILKEKDYDIVTYDPLLPEFKNRTLYEAVDGADYLAVLVNHSVIKAELAANREKIEAQMRTPLIRVF